MTSRIGTRLPRAVRLLIVCVVTMTMVTACDSPSTPPTTPTPPSGAPPVTQPPAVNPPVISGVTTSVTRAEAGQDVTISAAVEDSAPAVSTPAYEWTTNVGTITGNGTSAVWRVEPGTISEGKDVTVTLTVVKPYQVLENGQLAPREYRVTAPAVTFRAHDSRAEISRITLTFLVDLFGDSSKSPDVCLVDFSDACDGKDAERGDIVKNRKERRILSATARVESISFRRENTEANVVAPCEFRDINLENNQPGTSRGACVLTVVYEKQRWWLCTSNFQPESSQTAVTAGGRRPLRGMRYWE